MLLQRYIFKPNVTIGRLYEKLTDGSHRFLCYILEDEARPAGVKIPGATCIPAGEYLVSATYSNRFKKLMPIIYNRPDYTIEDGRHTWEGVRIHPGNTEFDTEGCPLTGSSTDGKRVFDSKKAFDEIVFPFIKSKMSLGKANLKLKIINDQDGELVK